jgi:NAD(P)-dependent dehydrogenase (short-subunit alcohol dehydrogenase family)
MTVVLINNAGTIEGFKTIHEHTPDIWWRTYEVVIRGNFLCTREAIRRALGRNHSSSSSTVDLTIVNITSQRSANTTYGNSGYATSKSALNRFTEFIHFEYEAEGVRAFAIHPGTLLSHLE